MSKAKVAFENQDVRIERKVIITKPIAPADVRPRKIAAVVKRVIMGHADEEDADLAYWLDKPVQERAAAVTHIISQSLKEGQRMDKGRIAKVFKHDASTGL